MSHIKIFIDGIMHLGDMIMSSSVIPVLKKHIRILKLYIWRPQI